MANKAHERKLLKGLRQVLSHVEGGRVLPKKTITVKEPDVIAIRKKTGLSQEKFSSVYGIPLATLRNWEQGRRKPEGPARSLLFIIDSNPKQAKDLLDIYHNLEDSSDKKSNQGSDCEDENVFSRSNYEVETKSYDCYSGYVDNISGALTNRASNKSIGQLGIHTHITNSTPLESKYSNSWMAMRIYKAQVVKDQIRKFFKPMELAKKSIHGSIH